ncbi:putative lipid binding protein [Tripterygium wilfordii]|uniref:Putative lipid binding protein n=1 Tax=Tripterygium wilfordii TaxID=458696 RepID=A0A7J7DZ48_TRIWF|nr:non-specific lipid transfer protein GPI-anchored 2-like [Tripterygium wilfordii]KAF5751660.1 putative lipid binding protein [Tripterygium wilfordii]
MSSASRITIATILLMTTLYGVSVSAQEPAEAPFAMGPSAVAPSPDCTSALFNLSDCLTYVESGSNLTAPDKPCCPELAGLVDSNPICLCTLLGKNEIYGVKIDLNKALKLPSICKVETPPPSLCSLVGVPVGGPTASEAPGSVASPPGGFAATPSTGRDGNGASSIAIPAQAFFIGLAIVLLPALF